ncbi:hypothetical protein EPN90_03280 [Patescibacteria group bacterium]|nr:MAG: hypothetical protein EPN90_03280 [Patescibacteria group bacterium]
MTTVSLDTRKKDLLKALVSEYVRTAAPVGSVTLVQKHGFDLSSATIRHELGALEELGLIEQPHTSAGRIPTERGFRTYVDLVISREASAAKTKAKIRLPQADSDPEAAVKSVAKHVAEQAQEAVLVAFAPRHIYYTGVSHLFSQPEFQEYGRVVRFSELIDRLDDIVGDIFPRVKDETLVWIGQENPFGNLCGTVIVRCPVASKKFGVLGILGPMRMDYERCYGLLNLTRQMLAGAFG